MRNSKYIWMKISFLPSSATKAAFPHNIKNPHTTPGGWNKLHCIFCGETCSFKSDPHNPSRWRAAYLCKTSSHGTGLSFKDSILEACGRWKDAWANQVEGRLQGVISDLHAAEARYHDSSQKNFMLFKIKEATTYASTSDTDLAFDKLVEDIISNKSNIWTSSEVHETICCMVAKDAAKLSLQNCRSILMTNWLFSLLQDSC